MGFVNYLVEVITHKESELSTQDHDEHNGSESRHKEDLEVQLHQPNPRRPVERLPSFEHGHGTAATQDLRFDFSGEGAVEGDNGIIFLGQHGSLNTLECDLGWDDDEDEDANADETDEDHLQGRNLLRAAHIYVDLLVVCLIAQKE